jgi:hypothetical protein
MADKVWFQHWRLVWFAAKMANRAEKSQKTDPKLAAAYTQLAELAVAAINAARDGKHDAFLKTLDMLQEQEARRLLDDMLNGTAPEVPVWLRKDRR